MKRKKKQFKMSELRIEKLVISHNDTIDGLETYEPELKKFLVEDALDNQLKKVSATYLWFERGSNEFIGYITLLADKINLDSNLKEKMKEEHIRYKELPAVKIGRLCVDDNYQKRGIGKLMIKFSIIVASEINEKVGCRFITLDAKRNDDPDKDAIHFYKKLGFTELIQIDDGKKKHKTTPLYRDLVKIFENIN